MHCAFLLQYRPGRICKAYPTWMRMLFWALHPRVPIIDLRRLWSRVELTESTPLSPLTYLSIHCFYRSSSFCFSLPSLHRIFQNILQWILPRSKWSTMASASTSISALQVYKSPQGQHPSLKHPRFELIGLLIGQNIGGNGWEKSGVDGKSTLVLINITMT